MIAAVVAVALLVAGGSVLGAVRAQDRARDAEAAGRAVRLHAEVWRVARTQLRETDLAALDALGHDQGTTLVRARQERVEARARAAAELRGLAEGDDEVAEVAGALVDLLDEQALEGGPEVRVHRVWDTLYDLQEEASSRPLGGPSVSALAALSEVALTPWYVVSDALDLEYVRTKPVVPEIARVYFGRSEAYIVSGEAGWLAADPADPFSGRWVPRDEVRAELPDVEPAVGQALASPAARRVVALDRWVQDTVPDVGIPDPPLPLPAAMADADTVAAELAPIVDRALADGLGSAREQGDAARATARVLWALAVCVLTIAGTGLVVIRRRRRHRLADLTAAAETDGLTGLANRRAVQRLVPPALLDPDRAGHVVVQIDLDRFKAVNDAYGHRVGDELLLAFAGRTTGVLERLFADREGEWLVARVGGDEFLVVLHDVADPRGEAEAMVRILERAFTDPVACGPIRIPLELSGGVAVATGPCDLERLLHEADIALYQAKARDRITFLTFDDPILRDIMQDFPGRVAAGAVRADLQPQVDLCTGEILGFEALARWSADGRVAVPAAVWIKAVEQLGGTDLLFQAVARSVGESLRELGPDFTGRCWLNLSPLQLGEPGSASRLLDHLAAAGLEPGRVGVEVLDTSSLSDLGVAGQILEELRAAGVAVALDDVGRGSTPLGHLTALPVDRLKLDRTVVAGIDRRPRQAALVEAMVTIAEKLGMELVAEGIETPAERDQLVALGVRFGQGYLLGRPVPVAEVDRLAAPVS